MIFRQPGGLLSMKWLLTSFVMILFFTLPSFAQDKKESANSKASPAYSRMIIEDFETSQYGESNIVYKVTSNQKGGISIRDQFPSPAKDSKKYLGVKILGKSGDVLQITPAKKLIIDKHCQSISIWVYGKDLSGELSILLKDGAGASHRIIMGRLNYLGWRELTVNIPSTVSQMDQYLSQKKELEITRIMFNPGNTGRLPVWNYFYMDDITATVRDKFYDKQSDEW
jgi:hypothetical protein